VRVVSLVPSATETLLALGVRPVACTRFCEHPELPTVGGTKDPDVAAVLALHPDLVVVNNEENRIADADALRAGGVAVHDCSPRSVRDVGPAVANLAGALGRPVPDGFSPEDWDAALAARPAPSRRCRAVAFVWRRPWMAMRHDTYGASMLATLGFDVVALGEPDERYPTVDLDDVRAAGPAVVLLPSEPYPFRVRHVAELEAALPGVAIRLVDGRDLFWWGIRTPAALARLDAALS
jgi:ABC-type Fe3+-hydroxamate transport system substrate-binding protein